jgi:DNA-binding LacI/PurR family transcriptional regulator
MRTDTAVPLISTGMARQAGGPRPWDLPPTPEIGVVSCGRHHQISSILDGVRRAARERKLALSTTEADPASPGALAASATRLRRHGVAGIIVIALEDALPELPTELSVGQQQLVIAGTCAPAGGTGAAGAGGAAGTTGVAAVGTDHRFSASFATRHLLSLGHRTVFHIAGRSHGTANESRVQGWRSALEGANAPVPNVEHAETTEQSGYEAGLRLIGGNRAVSAILCADDRTAIGVLRACAAAGRRVPHDISVMGYHDLPEAAQAAVPLSTVRPNLAALGEQCIRVLINALSTGTEPRVQSVPADLVIRNSTGRRLPH